jgi:hypothetical protein
VALARLQGRLCFTWNHTFVKELVVDVETDWQQMTLQKSGRSGL